MKNKWIYKIAVVFSLGFITVSCNRDDALLSNPNSRSEDALIPPSLILNHITSNLIKSDEMPFSQAHKTNQYFVSNYSYYWGSNSYSWTDSGNEYDIYLYSVKMEDQAKNLVIRHRLVSILRFLNSLKLIPLYGFPKGLEIFRCLKPEML